MGTKQEGKPEKSQSQLDFERKRIWSIAGGVTFFLAYVIHNGIVSIEFGEEEGEEDFDEVEFEEDIEDEDYEE